MNGCFFKKLVMIFFACAFCAGIVSAEDFDSSMPSNPGYLHANGTQFSLNDSDYLNISVFSTEEIELILESHPEMVSLMLIGLGASSTDLTLTGFMPFTTYHLYIDDYHNHVEFTTDENGSYSFTQDISTPHHIFIQPRPSTKFIRNDATGGNCTQIGIWNASTQTCTLTTDVSESIEIDSNGTTLDGNGRTITGTNSGYGVYLPASMKNVTIKNLRITKFYSGIYGSSYEKRLYNITIINNTVYSNSNGITIGFAVNSSISSNTISSNINGNYGTGVAISNSNASIVGNNVISGSPAGIMTTQSENLTFQNNRISCAMVGDYGGIYLQSYNITVINNSVSGCVSGIIINYGSAKAYNNTFNNNKYNFNIGPSSASSGNNIFDTSNTVNGKSIIYLQDVSNLVVDSSWNPGPAVCVRCNNVTFKDLDTKNNKIGVLFTMSNNSIVRESDMSANNQGVVVYVNCYNISIISNKIVTENNGVNVDYSSGTQILQNNISSTVTYNRLIRLGFITNYTEIVGNLFTSYGMGIDCSDCKNVSITDNTFRSLYFSIYLNGGNNVRIKDNYFKNNTRGIQIMAGNVSIVGNTLEDTTQYNFVLSGPYYGSSPVFDTMDIGPGNTIDGKPVLFLKGVSDVVIDETDNVGAFFCFSCNNVTVRNIALSKNSPVMMLFKSNNTRLENITIANGTAENMDIQVINSFNCEIIGSTFCIGDGTRGIVLQDSNNTLIQGNNATGCNYPYYFTASNWTRIYDNYAGPGKSSLSTQGIVVAGVANNQIINNTIEGNYYGIVISQGSSSYYYGNNFVSNNMLRYNRRALYLTSSSFGNVIVGNDMSWNNETGIIVSGSPNNTIIGNIISNNRQRGIELIDSASGNLVTNNSIANNSWDGVYVTGRTSNITGNMIDGNKRSGVYISSSSGANIIQGNLIINHFNVAADGVTLNLSSETIVENNIIQNNANGVGFNKSSSSYTGDKNILRGNLFINNSNIAIRLVGKLNRIYNNTIQNNNQGLYFGDGAIANFIFNNNFMDNTIQAGSVYNPSNNTLSFLPPLGGNYWSDFDTPSEGCDDADNDGFCDAPYSTAGATDYYAWTEPDGWFDKTPPQTTASVAGAIGANGWYSTDAEVTLSATDDPDGRGVSRIEYSLDEGNWNTYTDPLNISSDGTTIVSYRAIDRAGNIENLGSSYAQVFLDNFNSFNTTTWTNATFLPDVIGIPSISISGSPPANVYMYFYENEKAVKRRGIATSSSFIATDNTRVELYFTSAYQYEAFMELWLFDTNSGNYIHMNSFAVTQSQNFIVQTDVSGYGKLNSSFGYYTGEYTYFVIEGKEGKTMLSLLDRNRTLRWSVIYDVPLTNVLSTYRIALSVAALTNTYNQNIGSILDFINVTEVSREYPTLNISIDRMPPQISGIVITLPNELGWYSSNVVVQFNCTDEESGPVVETFDVIVSTEGTNQSANGICTDNAGNSASLVISDLNIDKSPPEIAISAPSEGAVYLLNQQVVVGWTVQDLVSGIESVNATAPTGSIIDTSIPGQNVFTVIAKDNAGNLGMKTKEYSVAYNYSGLLAPIKSDGSKAFKLGSVIPVKFYLTDANGGYISNASARLYIAKMSDNVTANETEAISNSEATEGNLFRYDAQENQYIFNLGTKDMSIGTWQLRIELSDGTSKTALIALK